ncbi:tol-Pal system protein TolA-like isoform X1 [Vanessa atalanta]|uniref:tol-Pal system protein TolA-like isoform X1 n=1 Tax=Vanessa atalanta TaxID=42275 RepID=UPI001FCD57AD|nr:tol-Pal system protein TolA-like isoform X1 [Vanessa atalanta]XP_047537538.1 tol-Pal system protein TolA-like isoform X1 [Vanessa atalanta]
MRAFSVVLLCIGSLSLASSAPVNQKNSPQRVEYDYEYDNSKSNQARDPAEAASHYDAYIQDVQAAATGGGNNAKKGFSQGSGLRTIAVGSANQAKTALGNQQAAAYQAAYVAKNTLAQSAAQSSATAQAALAGKQVILSGLEQQVRDAKVSLQGEEMQLQQAKRAAQSAAQAAQQAMHQVNVIQAALNAAQATSENANEAASQAAGELGAQTAMVGAARQRLQTLQEQLKGVRIDFEATQSAARKAQAAAQQAQANAAEAAAKAAAAGLGQHRDNSHEESGPIQIPANKPLHTNQKQGNAKLITYNNAPVQKQLAFNLSYYPENRFQPDNSHPVQYKSLSSTNQNEPLNISTETKTIPLLDSESYEKFPTFSDSGYGLNSDHENFGAQW